MCTTFETRQETEIKLCCSWDVLWVFGVVLGVGVWGVGWGGLRSVSQQGIPAPWRSFHTIVPICTIQLVKAIRGLRLELCF